MPTTSVSLLERMRNQNDAATWAKFVELYTPLLFSWAHCKGLQDQDAADLVQDVLLLLLEKLPKFTYDPNKTFRGWLRVVTHRKWLENRRGQLVLTGADDIGRLQEAAVADEPEAFWETEYRQRLTVRALEVMRDAFEEKTWLSCWEVVVAGKSVAQVGQELGMTAGAVYVAKSRVLKRLRSDLEGLLE